MLELVLIVVIIATILSLTLPILKKSLKNSYFKSCVNRVFLLFDYAKTQAILKNTIVEVKFDFSDKKIVLLEVDDGEDNSLSLYESFLPEKIYFQLTQEKILFYPDGTSQEFEVVISDDEGRRTVISTEELIEKVKVNSENR